MRVNEAGLADFSSLSYRLWRAAYVPAILGDSQSERLWQRSYAKDVLQAALCEGEQLFWIRCQGVLIGFYGYKARPSAVILQLTKLYLCPDFWGKGLGQLPVLAVISYARALGYEAIELYVFRQNTRAIRAYQRSGFRIDRAEYFEVAPGVGYDDFRMVFELDSAPQCTQSSS